MNQHMTATVSLALIRTCFESEHYPELFSGEDTHDPMLRFVAQAVSSTQDRDLIKRIVASGLPASYRGNTLEEIDRCFDSALAKGFGKRDADGQPKKPRPAEILLEAVRASGIELFHDALGRSYISVREGEKGPKNYLLSSSDAKAWLRNSYYKKYGKALNNAVLDEAILTLEAEALNDGPRKEVHLRIARHENSVIINLADQKNQAVVITTEGFEVVTDYPVSFVNFAATKALPEPEEGGDLKELQELLGLSDENFHRFIAFLINCLKPEGPYLFLLVEGEHGSGKSLLCQIAKLLIDPSVADRLILTKSEEDLMIHARWGHLLVFDNVSWIKSSISDVLCIIATGGGFITRKFYTNDEAHVFQVCRPFILNGITGVGERPDLLNRAISIKLPTMPTGQRKSEEAIMKRFLEMRPKLLGSLYRVVSGALGCLDIEASSDPRMADAAIWIKAAEPSLNLTEGTLIAELEESQDTLLAERMASNPLALAISQLIKERPYDGFVGDLHRRISDPNNRLAGIPLNSAHLSSALERLKPALEKLGIKIQFLEKTREGRPIRIWFSEDGTFEEAAGKRGKINPLQPM